MSRRSDSRDWTRIAEAGSRGALRFGLWAHRKLGRRPFQALLFLATLYYYARSARTRRASRRYLARVAAARGPEAAPPRRRDVVRHLYAFATSLDDRLGVWSAGVGDFLVEHDGGERLFAAARDGRGALLLGAHVGSFDMLRPIAERHGFTVNVLLYRENAQRINDLFESLAPESRPRIIELDPRGTRAAFEIRACLERGEFVAILADRVGPGQRTRLAEAELLGGRAPFSLAPFQLAALLGCPAFLTLCVRVGDRRYRTILRAVTDGLRVPRKERDKHAAELLRRYVAGIEQACLSHPMQWFNFYDFWGEESEPAP